MTAEPTAEPTVEPVIEEAPDQRALALSLGQEGIAFQQLLSAGAPVFNIPAALHLSGDLNLAALEQALLAIRDRHDLLRSTFSSTGEGHSRTVHAPLPWTLEVHDLSHLDIIESGGAAQSLVDQDAARPFDLGRESPFRCFLIRLRTDAHVLYWCMHHIACDGWSKSVFAQELNALYAHFAGTADVPPEGPAASYDDFVRLQRGTPGSFADPAEGARGRRTAHMTGVRGYSDLPLVRGRSEDRDFSGAAVALQIPAPLRSGIETLARIHRATPFMVALAAWSAQLHLLTGDRDVLVNAPFGGRLAQRFESVIGFFINVLLLPGVVADDARPSDLLQQARTTVLDALELQHVPYQELTRAVTGLPGGSRALTGASLSFQNMPYTEVALPGLKIRAFPLTRVDVRYDLELHLWDDGAGGYGGRLIYASELFDSSLVRGWAADYVTLLGVFADHPQTALSQARAALRGVYQQHSTAVPAPASTSETVGPSAHLDASVTAAHIDADGNLADTGHPGSLGSAAAGASLETEALVHDVWCELLSTDDIEREDSFLEIGGHSLLVALMVLRLEEETGVAVPISAVFRDPTIPGIARAIDEGRA